MFLSIPFYRLLANLTSPALLLYEEEIPADKTKRNYYLQIIYHLQGYKIVLGDERFWSVLSEKIGMILNVVSIFFRFFPLTRASKSFDIFSIRYLQPSDERSEEKGLVIERILILARNVLQIPADIESEKRTDSEGTVHDQVETQIAIENFYSILLFVYFKCAGIVCSEHIRDG